MQVLCHFFTIQMFDFCVDEQTVSVLKAQSKSELVHSTTT